MYYYLLSYFLKFISVIFFDTLSAFQADMDTSKQMFVSKPFSGALSITVDYYHIGKEKQSPYDSFLLFVIMTEPISVGIVKIRGTKRHYAPQSVEVIKTSSEHHLI